MKIALLISGYMRSLKLNVPNIKNKILELHENVDVYLHITENEVEEDKYFNLYRKEDLEYIKKNLNTVCTIKESNRDFGNNCNDLFNSWLKYYKLNQIKKINEKISGKYDVVIKYRPDINLKTSISLDNLEDCVYIPKNTLVDKGKLNNFDDEFVCDIMAYGKSEIMDRYFDIYDELENLVGKYGSVSETLLKKYFEHSNLCYKQTEIDYIVILSECNVFAITGDSGSGKTTLGNILKKFFSNSFMLECDRYHKWERSDPRWQSYTHLNPEANYISKMNEDIFNLKIGRSIYQVDYDHSNGKFTDHERIDSSENLIVCGLHSLYTENNNLYNLKIFVDTDVELRTLWKVRRDMRERGYELERIVKQVESRKKDYFEYIHPQKENSDIIVNFFPKKEISYTETEEPDLGLNIFINKIFNMEKVLIFLRENNIEYLIDDKDPKFFKITFDTYKPIFNSSFYMGNYYDYIVSCILYI